MNVKFLESAIELDALTTIVCQSIAGNKGHNIVVLNVEEESPMGERLVICTAWATRQVRAIAEDLLMTMKHEHGILPFGVEGRGVDQWVLLDYGSLLVHIFQPETRAYYDLDGLWVEAPRIPLSTFGVVESDDSEEESSSEDFGL